MKIFFAIVPLILFQYLHAQSTIYPRFAISIGANYTNMNFNKGEPRPANAIASTWKPGPTIGLRMCVPLGDRFSLQPEYNYVQRNGGDQSIATTYQLDYLSLPVLLHYTVAGALAVYAGPQAELLIHASANNGNKTNITHDTEERSLAAIGGIEYTIVKSFFVSARYMQGLNHIGIGQRSNVKEFKYQSASLLLGIRF